MVKRERGQSRGGRRREGGRKERGRYTHWQNAM